MGNLHVKPNTFAADTLVSCITCVHNFAFQAGAFSKSVKVAKVSIFHKKRDAKVLCNHRPISISQVASKPLEKYIHCRIRSHIDKDSLTTPCQFVLGKKQPTELSLLKKKL